MKKIVIMIPAYNEEYTIGPLVEEIYDVFKKLNFTLEVLVIDDGSSDDTPLAAENAGARVISLHKHSGLAEVFRVGVKASLESDSDIIVQIDADRQYNPAEIPKLLQPILENSADLVIGSRFAGTIEYMPSLKRFGNRFLTKVISRITKIKLTDAQTGFRVFTREVAEKMRIISHYTYTQEMIIRAADAGFRIDEVPIHFARRHVGKSMLVKSCLNYGIRVGYDLLRVWQERKLFNAEGLQV